MILVDTSIWIDHLRVDGPTLTGLLESRSVVGHAFVTVELACRTIQNRGEILSLLKDLPQADMAFDDEVLDFIERQALAGTGIGYVDAHLLASAVLTGDTLVWTRDKRLLGVTRRMRLDYAPPG